MKCNTYHARIQMQNGREQNEVVMQEESTIWSLLEQIPDPEIPVINIVELGMVRKVQVQGDQVIIGVISTYSGCPAIDSIVKDIELHLKKHEVNNIQVEVKNSPVWSTDFLSDETKVKLKNYGIAPPPKCGNLKSFDETELTCAYCDSNDVKLTSQFGSTPCKSLHFCNACQQPFEHFKCF